MTNKIALRSIEEFMTGYKPAYRSIMPLFLGNAVKYSVEVGKVDFKRAETIGDLEAKIVSPKDSELHMIGSKESTKTFKKYFLGAKYVQSNLQDTKGYEDVVAQVLDQHNKQSDALMLTGGGTSDGSVLNNGLFYSGDDNHVTNSSYEVQKDANGEHLADLYAKVMQLLLEADQVDGRKLVMFYGANVTAKVTGMFGLTNVPFTKALQDGMPAGYSQAIMPSAITPASSHGLLLVNLDQVKLHYSLLPGIFGQGVNEEDMYAWTNFLMGSSMLEVLASGAVTKQPLTFEA